MTFDQLNIAKPILRAIEEKGYKTPSPVQIEAIPLIMEGRDLIGMADTGTGKTAAFSIPILQQLMERGRSRNVRALILTPTRELASQVSENISYYGKYLPLKNTKIFGGVSQHHQVKQLRQGTDILISTPGRLLDLMNQRHISLAHLEFLVLDEADRMLDMGFIHDIKRIVKQVPENCQNVFFSATMPKEFKKLAQGIMKSPVVVATKSRQEEKPDIKQFVYHVEKGQKRALLRHIITEQNMSNVLVFTRTKHGANKITKDLQKSGISAEAIHGNKSQGAREKALSNFKKHSTRVLVATDIASRGIDINNLPFVINFEVPESSETYTHRIGRTGRAGASGNAYSLCDTSEVSVFKKIRSAHRSIEVMEHPYV